MKMNETSMQQIAEKLVSYQETGEVPADLFTGDVLCDFTPVLWRIQAQGLDDLLAIRRRGTRLRGAFLVAPCSRHPMAS